MLTILIVIRSSQVHRSVKPYQIIQFKCVQLIVCQLYFIEAIEYNRFLGHCKPAKVKIFKVLVSARKCIIGGDGRSS